MNPFNSIPFFRIIIPFITGIIAAIFLDFQFPYWISYLILIPFTISLVRKTAFHRQLSMLFADLFLFCFAVQLCSISDEGRQPGHFSNHWVKDSTLTICAQLTEIPVEKQRSIKCQVKILSVIAKDSSITSFGKSILYLAKTDVSRQLHAGHFMFVRCKFSAVPPPMNPYEFNYRQHLDRKHIYLTAFVPEGAFALVQDSGLSRSLLTRSLKIKDAVLTKLKHSKLDAQAAAICAALLTGFDDDIDQSTMNAFAHSGTLHVLSVSGLHTGLIYAMLSFLFTFFDRKKRYRILQFFLITIILWLFALLTGFAAPVLRAVIMFNLLGFGKLFFRSGYRNRTNILLLSAFLILLGDPWLLTDLGFLLSYFAMFGLFYFQPALSALITFDNLILKSLWTSITASFAATLSTLPITLIFFHQFPAWFFLCNIVVVPATFVILMLALLVLMEVNFAATVINFMLKTLMIFINLFNHEGSGYFENIDFDFPDAIFLSLLIILFSLALQYRSFRLIRLSLITTLCWQSFSLWSSYRSKIKSELTIYQIRKSTGASFKSGQDVLLLVPDSSSYNFSIKPHLIQMNYPKIKSPSFNYLLYGDARILFLNAPGFVPSVADPHISHLIISRNFKIENSDFRRFQDLKAVVCDGSNNASTRRHTRNLCRNLGFYFYATADSGAYICPLTANKNNETENWRQSKIAE